MLLGLYLLFCPLLLVARVLGTRFVAWAVFVAVVRVIGTCQPLLLAFMVNIFGAEEARLFDRNVNILCRGRRGRWQSRGAARDARRSSARARDAG